MKQIIALFLVFTVVYGQAQNFNEKWIFDNLSVVYVDVFQHEDTLVVTGLGSPNFAPYPAKLLYSKFDLIGSHISNTYAMYDSVKAYFPTKTVETSSRILTVGAGGYGNLIGDWGFMSVADKHYNIQWFKEYKPATATSTFFFMDGLITDEGSVVAVAVQLAGNSRTTFLTKFDSLGNKLWENEYKDTGYKYDPRSLLQWNDSTDLIGIKRYGLNQPSRNAILKVDAAGNYLGIWIDPNQGGRGVTKMLKTDDGGVIFVGHYFFELGVSYRVKAYVCRLDSNFNKVWEFFSGPPSGTCAVDDCTHFGDFIRLSDGNYVAVGRSGDSTLIDGVMHYKAKGTAVKFTPDGEILWERLYTYENNYSDDEILKGVVELDDGSLVACGQIINHVADIPQQGWMIKTFPNGKIDSLNQVFDIGGPRLSDAIRVRPNPAISYVDLKFLSGVIETLQIFDVEGHLVYADEPKKSQVRVDVGLMADGMYAAVVNGRYLRRFLVRR